jgi:hypothetical protein
VVLVDSPVEAMSKWVLDQPEQGQWLYVSVSQLADLRQVGRLGCGCCRRGRVGIRICMMRCG